MPYYKPGIEVTQSRESTSPNLVTPTLVPLIVGPGYHVEEISKSSSPYMSTYADTLDVSGLTTITYSGLDSNWTVDTNSVFVDITITSGANSQQVLHLGNDHASLTAGATSVAILAGLDSKWNGGSVQVGYRAVRNDLNDLYTIESPTDITDNIGKIDIWNPLALGVSIAKLTAGNNAVSYYGVSGYSSDEATAHTNAMSELELEEVYGMAPLTVNETIQNSYTTHCNAMSLPTAKKERINLCNPPIPWVDASYVATGDYTPTGANKAATAAQTRAAAYSYGESRAVWTFPDVLYAKVTNQHISTLHPTYIKETIWGGTDPKLNAILVNSYTIHDTTVAMRMTSGSVDVKYLQNNVITWPAKTEITSAIHDVAITSVEKEDSYVDAYVPVPGYYVAAGLAGKIALEPPQQPFTNLSLNILDGLKYSNDFFTESQLNTIADGGNFILTQLQKFKAPYYVRHQLTTNRDSVETQELSIIKTLDYIAKYARNALGRSIGRFNITPRYLKQLRLIVGSLCQDLVTKGVVSSIAPTTIAQHATQKDRVVITLGTVVFYPGNYIDLTIVY